MKEQWEVEREERVSESSLGYPGGPHLVKEVLAIWSVCFHYSCHLVDATVESTR